MTKFQNISKGLMFSLHLLESYYMALASYSIAILESFYCSLCMRSIDIITCLAVVFLFCTDFNVVMMFVRQLEKNMDQPLYMASYYQSQNLLSLSSS